MILVVEDDQITQAIVAKILGNTKFEVDITADAYQAIANIRQNNYIVALIDLVLPGPMNGINLIKQIRKYSPTIKIIACSSYGSQQQSRLAARAGANMFLLKPFKPNELIAAVTHMVGKAPLTVNKGAGGLIDIKSKSPLLFSKFPEVVIEDIMKLGRIEAMEPKSICEINFTEEIAIVLEGTARCLFANRDLGNLKVNESIGQEFIAEGFDPESTLGIQAIGPTKLFLIHGIDLVKYLHAQGGDLLVKLKNNIRFLHPKSLFTLALQDNIAKSNSNVNISDISGLGLDRI